MAFAATLNRVVNSKKKQVEQRGEIGLKWNAYEAKLLDQAVELFRLRCQREASQRRCHLTASFEVLSREIPGFPSHVVKDSTYVVNSWGKEKLAEAWYYATHGTAASWSPGAPVLFAEMLEGMMPKFLERLTPLGFKTCHREAGTWKVRVEWDHPSAHEDEEETDDADDEEKEAEAKEPEEKKEDAIEIADDEKKEEPAKDEEMKDEEKKEEEEKEVPTEDVEANENGENKENTENGEKTENGAAEIKAKTEEAKKEAPKKEKKPKKKKEKTVPDTFAGTLTQLVADMIEETKEKEAVASKWDAYESKLLDQAVELFKGRCTKEAEAQRLDATVSFEVLSREIADFPKRVVKDSNYFVESWNNGVTAESWFFSTHGTNAHYNAGDPVLFAEVLECMMPKFLEKLGGLGFLTARREPGTWKVSVTWADPDGEPAPKKQKLTNGHGRH